MHYVPPAMKTDLLSNAPQTVPVVRAYHMVDSPYSVKLAEGSQTSQGVTASVSSTGVLTLSGTALDNTSFTFDIVSSLSGQSSDAGSVRIRKFGPSFPASIDLLQGTRFLMRYFPTIYKEPAYFFNVPAYNGSCATKMRINIGKGQKFSSTASVGVIVVNSVLTFDMGGSNNVFRPDETCKTWTMFREVGPSEYKSIEYSIGTSTSGFTTGEVMAGKLTFVCLTSVAEVLIPDDYDESSPTRVDVWLTKDGVSPVDMWSFYLSRAESEFGENYSTLIGYDRLSFAAFDRQLFYDDRRFMFDTTGNGTPDSYANISASIDLAEDYIESVCGWVRQGDLLQYDEEAQQSEINTIQLVQMPSLDDYTLRNCIRVIAANNYANVAMQRQDAYVEVTKFLTPSTNDTVSIGPANYKLGGFVGSDTTQKTINGVRVFYRPDESSPAKVLYDSSDGGNALVVPQEMSWRFANEACANAFYQNGAVYGSVIPLTLTFGRIECFGLPFVEIFDHVEITDTNGDTYDIQPCSIVHRYDGGWHSTFECRDTLDDDGGAVISPSSKVNYEPAAAIELSTGESNGWSYSVNNAGMIHAFRRLLIDLSDYSVRTWGEDGPVAVTPSVDLPFKMKDTEYVVETSTTHWAVPLFYVIAANCTTTQFDLGIFKMFSSSDTMIAMLTLDGMVDMDALSTGDIPDVPSTLPAYLGPTTVTPSLNVQTLDTNNHSMYSDVTVYEIPRADTSNDAGGTTVTIGG